MKWMEVVELKKVDFEDLIKFLKDNILSRFSFPDKFITDNGSIFIGSKFTEFCREYGIIMGQPSNYYPQGNGLVESTNKTLVQILKKTIDRNQTNWHLKLTDALWESKTTPKDSIGMSPYTLVYGKEVKMPISLKLNALTYVVNTKYTKESSPIQRRIN
jgi:transposase InsO family protein